MRTGALTLMAGLVCGAVAARAEIIDGVAVVVNGSVITLSEVEERAGTNLPSADATGELKSRRDGLLKHAAEDLVVDKLVSGECKTQNLEPTSNEVDDAVENVMRQNHVDRATLETAIQQQGLTMARYRQMLTDQLCRMKVVEMKARNRTTVTEDEINAYLRMQNGGTPVIEEIRLRDIYVPAGPAAEATVLRVKAGLDKGADYATVPKAQTAGAARLIDLGWVKFNDLRPDYHKAVEHVPNGGISAVVASPDGYHIFRVDDRRSKQDLAGYANLRDQAREAITQEKIRKATEDYIAELKSGADITYKLP